MKPAVTCRRSRGSIARAAGIAAALLAGMMLAGCGLGPGKDTGDASLLVTRDYGSTVLIDKPDLSVNESSNAMRILDQNADLDTLYGGEFVQSVDGVSGDVEGSRSYDWFFAVNGIVAERGSAQFPVTGGDKVWWDYRDWTDAMEVGAVVGDYPAPFSTGYDGRDWGVEVDCLGDRTACGMVTRQLEGDGVDLTRTGDDMKLLVGTWDDLKDTDEGHRLERGPGSSGVFARFDNRLLGLDPNGQVSATYPEDAGLVAAMRQNDDPPVWLVTGIDDQGVQMAAAALNPEDLERRYAAVVSDGQVSSLPLR